MIFTQDTFYAEKRIISSRPFRHGGQLTVENMYLSLSFKSG